MEEEARLEDRWKAIYQFLLRGKGGDDAEVDRLKDQWFQDAFSFVERLPIDEHLWCGHKNVVWQLLEPFHYYDESDRLQALWKRMSASLGSCFKCVTDYNGARDFYEEEFPELQILPVLRELDKVRVLSRMRQILQKLEPIASKDLSLVFELLLYPDLVEDAQVSKVFLLLLRYVENTICLDLDRHPEIFELLFSSKAVEKLSHNATRFGGTNHTRIQLVLKKIVTLFDQSEASPSSGETLYLQSSPENKNQMEKNDSQTETDDSLKTVIDIDDEETETDKEVNEVATRKRKRGSRRCIPCTKKKPHLDPMMAHDLSPAPLDDWYKRILSLDFENMDGQHSEDLLEVPLSFKSYQDYLDVFRPLCFTEFKAHLQRSIQSVDLSRSDVVAVCSLRQTSYFHLLDLEYETVELTENDLLLLRHSSPGNIHMLGKVERRKPLSVKVYLPHSDERLAKAREMLICDSRWRLCKLMSITTFVREQQAILAMRTFPLLETILSASYSPNEASAVGLPQHLLLRLRNEYNDSQLRSIEAVAQNSGKISLIQGPPGTGKTRTILGIISALLASANEQASKEKEQDMLEMLDGREPDRRIKSSVKSTRILICAQSNAAVDELVRRIADNGVYDNEGAIYRPSIARLGDQKRVHTEGISVHIDQLVAEKLAPDQGIHHTQAELCSKLDQILEKMQVLPENGTADGTLAKLADLQKQQTQLLTDLMKLKGRQSMHLVANRKKQRDMQLQILKETEVVLTTLSGCGGFMYATLMDCVAKEDPRTAELLFDAVIVDEAAQAVEPTTLIPLQLLKRSRGTCILVGDPKQLPATVHSIAATRLLFDCSLFERFQKNGYPVNVLTTQYRMHPQIRCFPSMQFYDGQLIDGNSVLDDYRTAPFHRERRFQPYRFFDVQDGQERLGSLQSQTNPDEAEFIFQLIRALKERYPQEVYRGRIGVVTPYQEQRRVLKERLGCLHLKIEVSTVDSFQGREADIIVLSTVRAAPQAGGGVGFVGDIRRMNVALTRAKFSLWIVGNARTLEKSPHWQALLHDSWNRDAFSSVWRPYGRAVHRI